MRNRACAAGVSRLSHMLELADRLVGIYKTCDVTKSVTMCVATPRTLRARDRPRPLCACSAPAPRGKRATMETALTSPPRVPLPPLHLPQQPEGHRGRRGGGGGGVRGRGRGRGGRRAFGAGASTISLGPLLDVDARDARRGRAALREAARATHLGREAVAAGAAVAAGRQAHIAASSSQMLHSAAPDSGCGCGAAPRRAQLRLSAPSAASSSRPAASTAARPRAAAAAGSARPEER